MLKNSKISSFRRKLAFSILLVGVAAFSFASKGGGAKPKTSASNIVFSPVKLTNGFTLKAGPSYRINTIFDEVKTNDFSKINSIATYQKGNTTYILPYKSRVSVSAGKSNLQLVNLKLNIRK